MDNYIIKHIELKDEKEVKFENGDQFQCQHCRKIFGKILNLRVHIRSIHQLKESHCQICGKTFPKKKSLANHINEVHSSRKSCGICSRSFKPSTFRKHRKTCQPSYSCPDCDYQTIIKQELYSHRRTHNVEIKKVFKCLQCPYSSNRIYNVEKHMQLMHTKKLKCDIDSCDKEFAHKESLERHKENHYQKHVCNICEKQFVRKSNLEKHVQQYHIKTSYLYLNRTQKIVRKNNCFYCPKCDYNSNRKSNLKVHIHRRHNKPKRKAPERAKQCNRCDKTFTRYDNLKKHLLRCKDEKSIILFLWFPQICSNFQILSTINRAEHVSK